MNDDTDELGTITALGEGEYESRFVRDLPHEVTRVWAAITDPRITVRWWAEARIDARVGGEFRVRWLNGEDGSPREWLAGEIVGLDAPRFIELTNEAHGVLRWQLAPTPGGTRLVFTVGPVTEEFATMSLAGWHVHLDHLAAVLDGAVDAVDWPNWYRDYLPRWERVRAGYQTATGLP